VGLVVAFGFATLQVNAEPYKEPGNNFLAMCANAALVLYFVAALGVQVDHQSALMAGNQIAQPKPILNERCLAAALFFTTFIVFLITSITFLIEIRRGWRKKRVTLQELIGSVLRASRGTLEQFLAEPLVQRGSYRISSRIASAGTCFDRSASLSEGEHYSPERASSAPSSAQESNRVTNSHVRSLRYGSAADLTSTW
jgi:hypothetical protein